MCNSQCEFHILCCASHSNISGSSAMLFCFMTVGTLFALEMTKRWSVNSSKLEQPVGQKYTLAQKTPRNGSEREKASQRMATRESAFYWCCSSNLAELNGSLAFHFAVRTRLASFKRLLNFAEKQLNLSCSKLILKSFLSHTSQR